MLEVLSLTTEKALEKASEEWRIRGYFADVRINMFKECMRNPKLREASFDSQNTLSGENKQWGPLQTTSP